jgi:formylglycine-generating enzyme required for sulfatase activity
VVLSRPFYLGIHETTQEQFAELMQRNPSFHAPTGEGKNSVGDDTSRHPVETVTWVEAQQFCLTLSVREKLQGAVPEISHEFRGHGENYFLPTEAEWEFACRAGSESTYWFGPDLSEMPSYGWCAGISSGYTHEVGQLQANPFGLHDMYGNVYEWCFDWLDLTTYQRLDTLPVVDPRGPASTPDEHFRRVHRGGAFHEHPAYCRTALRHGSVAFASGNSIGFRVALSIDGARESLRHGHLNALSPGEASP